MLISFRRAERLMTPFHSIKQGRLWNKNFVFLWLGQFISAAGDVFYTIALGFWILDVYHSTALLGSLMAFSLASRLLISPLAGVVVDRTDRKRLLILMDVFRGLGVGLVGLAAVGGFLKAWMLFLAASGIGIGGAFFNPSITSVLPEITIPSKLIKANSFFGMIFYLSGIFANAAGGILYAISGISLLLLMNALSYLVSAGSISLISIPKTIKGLSQNRSFWKDMKSGFKFVWDLKPLKLIMLLASIVNFFGSMVYVLLLPMFEKTEGLGPKSYGVVMAFYAGGLLGGMLFTSIVNIKPSLRYQLLFSALLLFSFSFAAVPLSLWLPAMAFFVLISGFCNALISVFINTTIQMVVPNEFRGRVFSLFITLSGALIPLAYAVGGIMAEFVAVRPLISMCCIMIGIISMPMALMASLKRFINFDPTKNHLENI